MYNYLFLLFNFGDTPDTNITTADSVIDVNPMFSMLMSVLIISIVMRLL